MYYYNDIKNNHINNLDWHTLEVEAEVDETEIVEG